MYSYCHTFSEYIMDYKHSGLQIVLVVDFGVMWKTIILIHKIEFVLN